MTKIDCVNISKDITCLPFSIIPRNTDQTMRDAINGQDKEFIQDMIEFGMIYGEIIRYDHHLFFKAFRNNQISGLYEAYDDGLFDDLLYNIAADSYRTPYGHGYRTSYGHGYPMPYSQFGYY